MQEQQVNRLNINIEGGNQLLEGARRPLNGEAKHVHAVDYHIHATTINAWRNLFLLQRLGSNGITHSAIRSPNSVKSLAINTIHEIHGMRILGIEFQGSCRGGIAEQRAHRRIAGIAVLGIGLGCYQNGTLECSV